MTKDPDAVLRKLIFGTTERKTNKAILAKKIKRNRTTMYKWEKNPGLISVTDLRRICRVMGISWEQLGKAIGGIE